MNPHERWIVIPNWDDFQHYKDRDPVWIKTFVKILHKDEYMDLTFHQRGILHGLWVCYARSNRQLRDNTATLTRQLGHRVLTRDLEALNHAGFIQFRASKPLAQSKRQRHKELATGKTTTKPRPHKCPVCNVKLPKTTSLATHLRNVHNQENPA